MQFTTSLKKNADFRTVYKKRKSKADKRFVVYVLKNGTNENRLGISVSKKVGNSVVRHRIKRLVKESYRLNEGLLNNGYDIVVVARTGAVGASYFEVCDSILFLFKLQGLRKKEKTVN